MHIERLTALAALLDVTAPEKFNLSTWHCGTAACAVGHAASHPEFMRQGLTLEAGHWGMLPVLDFADGTKPLIGWKAVESFFDLNFGQSGDLFSSAAYSSRTSKPTNVAARIRKFIQGNRP